MRLQISPHYDSLLGKLMVWAPTRAEAIARMSQALTATKLQGVPNNLVSRNTLHLPRTMHSVHRVRQGTIGLCLWWLEGGREKFRCPLPLRRLSFWKGYLMWKRYMLWILLGLTHAGCGRLRAKWGFAEHCRTVLLS